MYSASVQADFYLVVPMYKETICNFSLVRGDNWNLLSGSARVQGEDLQLLIFIIIIYLRFTCIWKQFMKLDTLPLMESIARIVILVFIY